MYIAVENRYASDFAFGLQGQSGYRAVVEHTVAFAVVAKSVVSAAAEVDAFAGLQGCACRRHRRTARASRAFDQLRRPGEADPTLLLAAKLSRFHARQVAEVMRPQNFCVAGTRGRLQIIGSSQPFFLDTCTQQRVFLHRKAELRGQWQHVVIGVEDLQSCPSSALGAAVGKAFITCLADPRNARRKLP
jgi:hypothetical protein